ncbi:hypothetical protein [Gilvimarinus algae]|uniref:Uncharacterized protein n=1 Tax=Gilvimarinus algae TaxID=3058037 RepID=A0ABT8TEJ2_9GAMM|nr:hypothetical protein [Gilvimarinus sp. SDUM040014]MDO3382380.1 hypothetical protein [Gilvimarinus sp. SDUM040014]
MYSLLKIRKKMRTIVILMVMMLLPSAAFGRGEVERAIVVKVRVDNDGKGYVAFEQPLGGIPASCTNEAHASHLAFDVNTEAGKAVMGLALLAYSTGKPVYAKGTDTCDTYGSVVEDWHWGYVHEGE